MKVYTHSMCVPKYHKCSDYHIKWLDNDQLNWLVLIKYRRYDLYFMLNININEMFCNCCFSQKGDFYLKAPGSRLGSQFVISRLNILIFWYCGTSGLCFRNIMFGDDIQLPSLYLVCQGATPYSKFGQPNHQFLHTSKSLQLVL